jgi:hypothetical protein
MLAEAPGRWSVPVNLPPETFNSTGDSRGLSRAAGAETPLAARMARSLRWPQVGQNRVAQIKLALDPPAPFVFQLAGAVERIDELPLRFDQ